MASNLVMAGVDLRTAGKILGHKDPKVTLRYAHLAPDFLKNAVERLEYSVSEDEGEKRQDEAH